MLSCIDWIMESLVPCGIVIEGVVWDATMDGYGGNVRKWELGFFILGFLSSLEFGNCDLDLLVC